MLHSSSTVSGSSAKPSLLSLLLVRLPNLCGSPDAVEMQTDTLKELPFSVPDFKSWHYLLFEAMEHVKGCIGGQ